MSAKTSVRAKLELAQNFRVGPSFTDEAIQQFLQALRCPRALTVWLLFKNKEYQQLVDLGIDPHHYNDLTSFRDAYTATSFLSKANFLPLEVSKEAAAYEKFFKFEELCKSTNRRLRSPHSDPLYKGQNVWLLNATKRKIEQILVGYSPEELADSAYWGPGVSTLIQGEEVSATNKFQNESGITPDLLDFISPWFATAYPSWAAHLESRGGFTPQSGNKIITVPKSSKTDRVIAIEPGINLWFQKGIGSMIRRRLRRVGIDLNSQTRNQHLAQQGSFFPEWHSDCLATVDFSSASDSISRDLVEELLPWHWFVLMDVSRSKIGFRNDGQLIRWEKFSSMGNGFTFELESLIFYAAATAVCEYHSLSTESVSVFGDDVIIPNSVYESFAEFSAFLGFKVNNEKSFSSSSFRESCGSHYFNGSDCKPIFLKERMSNVQTVYKLANSVRLLAHRRNSHSGCDRRLYTCWSNLFRRVPEPIRLRVSSGFGDTGFVVNFDEASPSLAHENPKYLGYEGFLVESLVEVAVTRQFDETGLLLARVSRGSEQEENNSFTLRGRTKKRVKRILVPRWYHLGPWS